MEKTWHSLKLGNGEDAFPITSKIKKAHFEQQLIEKIPEDCMVLTDYDVESNCHTAYFSPSASLLAEVFKASPCEKPRYKKGLSPIAGSQNFMEIFYSAG